MTVTVTEIYTVYNPGGSGGPTATYNEVVQLAEALVSSGKLSSTVAASEVQRMVSALADTITVGDQYSTTAQAAISEGVQASDAASGAFTWPATARSASPDSDPWGDAGGSSSNGTTNNGSATTITLSNSQLNFQKGYMEIDLTRFSGLAASGPGTLTLTGSNANVATAATITFAVGTSTSRPFVESTVTYNNAPAAGAVTSKTGTLAAGASNVSVVLAFTQSEMQSMLGKWVYLFITSGDAVLTQTINTREATASLRPSLQFSASR